MRKIRNLLLLSATAIFIFILSGCNISSASYVAFEGETMEIEKSDKMGGGDYSLEVRDIYIYSADDVKIVILPQEGIPRVRVVCASEFETYGLSVSIEDGKIIVRGDPTKQIKTTTFLIEVSASISSVNANGKFTLDFTASEVEKMDIVVNGAFDGAVNDISAADMSLTVNGTANLTLLGRSESFECTINGSASINTKELESKEAGITINGNGSVSVYAKEKLNVAINGIGTVTYYGEATVSQSITGSGSVRSGD